MNIPMLMISFLKHDIFKILHCGTKDFVGIRVALKLQINDTKMRIILNLTQRSS